MIPEIPEDVKKYVKQHFAKCNKGIAEYLFLFPAIHAESLDMKRLILLLALTLTFSLAYTQVRVNNCSAMLNGTFKYLQDDSTAHFVINDSIHIEYHKMGKYFIKSKIQWISKCNYNLVLQEATLPNFLYKPGSVLSVSINSINKNIISITSKTESDSWDAELIKYSEGHLPLYHPGFGKYYQIDNYHVYAPFAAAPHISPVQDHDKFKIVTYTYVYPRPEDDPNIGYGIVIQEIKDPTLVSDQTALLDFTLASVNFMFKSAFDANIIEEEITTYRNRKAYSHKALVNDKTLGNIYVQSLIFLENDLAVRLFVMIPVANDDNQRVHEFLESIQFD